MYMYRGSSYGLEHCCQRFIDHAWVSALRPATPVKGLFLTGQDLVTAGVAGAGAAGLLTGLRVLGIKEAIGLWLTEM